MPLEIIRNDITAMHVDAIVNAANNRLDHGGGVCGAIHKAAGSQLLAECRTLGGCRTGEAKITRGYDLPAKFVIHTVGPVWQDGHHGERELLTSCYRNSLNLARANGCTSIAFPLISSGIYGYPKDQALKVATESIGAWLIASADETDMQVSLVVFDKSAFKISAKLYAGIAEYISDHYVEEHSDFRRRRREYEEARRSEAFAWAQVNAPAPDALQEASGAPMVAPAASLEDALGMIDEGFSQMLIRKIDEKGMTDPECYKRANLDRKLFSKIRNDVHYKPKKTTALAFAVALRLSLLETQELLLKAGLALSHSDVADIIVEYFIVHGKYDIFEINEALYQFDQVPLGAKG